MKAARKTSIASRAAQPAAPTPAPTDAVAASSGEQHSGERRKAAQAFRTIAEVSEELDIAKHVLRFWEIKFAQLRPMKRGGGRRFYRPDDVELLRGIRHLLQAEAFTIKGVQKILREQGVEVVKRAGALPAAVDAGSRATRRGRAVAPPTSELLQPQAATPGAAGPNGLSTAMPRTGDMAAVTAAIRTAIRDLEAIRATLAGDVRAGHLDVVAGDTR